MNPSEYWQWLSQFITLLEEQAQIMSESPDPKTLAQLRVAERTLNFEIDQFMHRAGSIEDMDGWNKLKSRRDALADHLSTLLESDVKLMERYEQYCEALKNHRTIGAML